MRKPVYPNAIEHSYAVHLRKRCVYLYRLVNEEVNEVRTDADGGLYVSIMDRLYALRSHVSNLSRKGAGTVARVGSQVDKFVTGQLKKAGVTKPIKNSYPISGWVTENVSLIQSIDARYFDDLEKYISKAYQNGTLTADLSKIIRERTKVSKSRANVIARDQIGKLNGQIMAYRQQSLGIRKYRWSTSGDERVRPEHKKRNNRVFDWNNPPSDGSPGMAIQCRCVAVPVIEGFEEEEAA